MSTVVGLVKSRLRSRSKRGKSVGSADVVVNEDGQLIRYTSLRQHALAEPTEGDLTISPVRTNSSGHTPTGLDPFVLANALQDNEQWLARSPAPPVPSLPKTALPPRHSSLHNSKAHRKSAHRRAASQDKRVDLEPPARRRHNTISSPDERPRYNPEGDYFSSVPPNTTMTRTADLFGKIKEHRKRKSLESQGRRSLESQDQSSRSSRGSYDIPRKPLPALPRSGGVQDLSDLQHALPEVEPVSPLESPVETDQDSKPLPVSPLESPVERHHASKPPPVPPHVHLPPGFKPGYTEETTVDEIVHPAIINETIEKRRIEIYHPEISRDIHINHYYRYEQPISVTEVLPAKHYYLDVQTGQKTEIEAPAHWRMPENLTPRIADYSGLKGTQRHYLVDRDHPNGIPEEWHGEENTWI